MSRHRSCSSLVSLFMLVVLTLSGCGVSSASYARFRRAASEGQVVAAEEVRAADFIDVHASEDAPRPPVTGDPERLPILLDARLGNSALPSEGGRAVLQISLRGGTSIARLPASVIVVVDVSGSMQDEDKIGAVRHALARFVETLDVQDRLAIVTFSDGAHVALPPSSVASSRAAILEAVGNLSAYGGTNLGAGLGTAISIAATMREGGVPRIVLLSDGVATVGETSPELLAQLGTRAHDAGIAVSTIGMGNQIDFALLEALANRAGGAFHYLDRPAEVERVFATELASLTQLAARDAHVRIALPEGVSLARSYDERTSFAGGVLDTSIGDVAGDEAIVVVHELDVAPGASLAEIPIEITLSATDGTASIAARTAIRFTRTGSFVYDGATDAMVLRNVTLGRIAWSVREASHLLDVGDARTASLLANSALTEASAAQLRLRALGDDARARSLDEPIALLGATARTLPPPPAVPTAQVAGSVGVGEPGWTVTSARSSSSFAGWR
jgi:Ca-activated chloride channel family protein